MPFPEKISGYFLPLQEPGKGRANREADREKAETGEREKDPNARYYSERSDRLCCCPASRRERPIRSFRKLQKYATFLSFREPVRSWMNRYNWDNKSNATLQKKKRNVAKISTVSAGAQFVPPFQKKSVLIFALETGGRPRQKRFSRAHEGGGRLCKRTVQQTWKCSDLKQNIILLPDKGALPYNGDMGNHRAGRLTLHPRRG